MIKNLYLSSLSDDKLLEAIRTAQVWRFERLEAMLAGEATERLIDKARRTPRRELGPEYA